MVGVGLISARDSTEHARSFPDPPRINHVPALELKFAASGCKLS